MAFFVGTTTATPRLSDFQTNSPFTPDEEEIKDEDLGEWELFLSEPWSAIYNLSQHLKGVPYASVFLTQMCRYLLHILTNKVNCSPPKELSVKPKRSNTERRVLKSKKQSLDHKSFCNGEAYAK